jgi:hypothetical protein
MFFVLRYILIFRRMGGLGLFLPESGLSAWMRPATTNTSIGPADSLPSASLPVRSFTTIASIDWFKTLNYHWFSTMYGVWFFSASMRAALSATVLMLFWQAGRREGLKGILQPVHTYLLGCLMLAFTVFWAYISFSQFFLIYNANIPEETFWYNIRELTTSGSKSGWYLISRLLIFLHFFAPFLFLLWYKNKFAWRLKMVAIWILVFHFVDLIWNILPQKLADPHPREPGWIHHPSARRRGADCRFPGADWRGVCLRLGLPSLCSPIPFHSHSRSAHQRIAALPWIMNLHILRSRRSLPIAVCFSPRWPGSVSSSSSSSSLW